MGFLRRFFNNRFVARILETQDSPKRVARGAALGSFIAVTPTVGVQIPLTLLTATVLRGNRLIAVAMTFVLNPFIIVPPSYWYFPAYYLGAFLLGAETVGLSRITLAYSSAEGLFDLLGNLWALGLDIYGPMLLGGAIIGIPIAFLMYWISLRIALRRQARRAEAADARAADGGEVAAQNNDSGAGGAGVHGAGPGTGQEA
jgi:uncharacterized protein (DUF2062 family)